MSNDQQHTVLIVDDDLQLQQLLSKYLGEQGYIAAAVGDGKAMDLWFKNNRADLIILDLMLPGEDGLSLARRIRLDTSIPIIILSARGEELDKIIGLEVGADDYLAKPFNPRELLARIRAVLRRGSMVSPSQNNSNERRNIGKEKKYNEVDHIERFGDFRLNLDSRILWKNDSEIELTSGEMDLLITLATHPNRVLSREQLMDMLNEGDSDPFDRSIDVRITRLRRKLDDSSSKSRYIRTVWGQGYRFTPDPD